MPIRACFSTGPLPFEGIAVAMDSRRMNGTQRVVFDRVLTESECKDLLRLTKVRPVGAPVRLLSSSAGRGLVFPWRRDGSLMRVFCILLFQAAGEAGDGYRARRSPHTPHERFEGLTVLRAVQVSGSVSLPPSRLPRKSVCHPSVFLCEVHSGWSRGCVIFFTSPRAVSPDPLPPR